MKFGHGLEVGREDFAVSRFKGCDQHVEAGLNEFLRGLGFAFACK
jgi:hypothetical protein